MFKPAIDPRHLASKLLSEVPRLADDPNSNPRWTAAVADVLHDLGRKGGYAVHSHETETNTNCHEWMCDVVWYQQPTATRRGMVLAAESEWGNLGCVLDDFEKLVSVKAPLKVVLYAFKEGSKRSQEIDRRIKEYLKEFPYHLAGECYIFVEYRAANSRARILTIERDGQTDGFNIREIASVPNAA